MAYWESRRERDWSGVSATFSRHANQQFKDESLLALPSGVKRVEVDWIVSLDRNEDAARVGYEIKFISGDDRVRRAAFTDKLMVEDGGWRLRDRRMGLK